MCKKNIYLVQASSTHSDLMPLPYAVAVLHAYVSGNNRITDEFAFADYIFEKKPIAEVIAIMEQPYAVFFSCYIWNTEYNKMLASSIRKKFPETILVFGGHHVPVNLGRAFRDYPDADYLLLGEGERPFEDLLLYLMGDKRLGELRNIASKDADGRFVCAFQPDYITDRIVSPYQMGLFDDLVRKHGQEYRFSATLETNRGCPFSCGYCDWGLNRAPLRMAPEEQVFADIAWMAEHQIYQCYGADSNFGMFSRDLQFASFLCKQKKEHGYPQSFFVSFSKNSNERVLAISSMLQQAGMLQGATLSFQSLNPATLQAVGRKNLDLQYFTRLMREYSLRRIPTYSELILGLPLETKESFKRGIGTLIACGQHMAIDVYACCILPNSDLGQPETMARYGIVARRLPFRRFDIPDNEEVQEYSDIVVATNSMSQTDWIECNLFSNVVSALHCGKLFHCIALYLHREFRRPYENIYTAVIDAWRSDPGMIWPKLIGRMEQQLAGIANGYGNWQIQWEEQKLKDVSFRDAIQKVVLRNYDAYLEMIEKFIQSYCDTEELIHQLARYQAFCFQTRIDRNTERSKGFTYRFDEYFDRLYLGEDAELQQGKCQVTGEGMLQSVICQ